MIVGGEAAVAGDFPFIVSLQQSGSHFCGGSLLNANTVLTAAHCSQISASSVTVRAGSLSRTSGGTLVKVSSIKVHPSYNADTTDYDVAIWKLATSIPESSTVGYATLPASGQDPAAGVVHTTAGWGTTTEGGSTLPTALRKVDVPIISRANCNTDYGSGSITSQMFCAGLDAGGKDSCQGDSGGPIVEKSTKLLVGTVSWGQGCARAAYPGVYARTGAASLASFIAANK
ncbi:trypsin-domain-containing protein [Pseudovirgaria hyperparasitica]|uniref:Trypsin-domain-containing protein n=1 Tax=Pseudovirgaria hyperparasitica TaxID=470096 RepID=A0A6A6W3N2_9PEZI|nr:trypsin-domain-containing protein [Pseudovirgaria hyperparasitica]KAF2756540.1 trypsin-domain-containing protein [Pseudovirgaria hyperparasitica]